MKSKNTIILIVLFVLLVCSGLFVVSKYDLSPKTQKATDFSEYELVNDSDEVDQIETDLEETDLENMDSELLDIETELESSLSEYEN